MVQQGERPNAPPSSSQAILVRRRRMGYTTSRMQRTSVRAFIGLGSNLGDRLGFLRSAAQRLATLGTLDGRSAVYETAPLGPPQPDYLNAVVSLSTRLDPEQVLAELLKIECNLGRVRRERWGPRTIDLDVLAIDGFQRAWPTLTLPHPEIARRAFVLRPWLDLDRAFIVPGVGSVQALWEALPQPDREAVRPFATAW